MNKIPQGMMGLPVVRHLSRKPRLLVSIGVAAAVFALACPIEHLSMVTSSLLAWNCATVLYIGLAIETMLSADAGLMYRRAQLYDDGEGIILAFTVLAAILSIVAIVFELATSKQLHGLLRGLHVGLSTLTLLTSWSFIHIAFAFHYAHGYYSEGEPDAEDPCLIFPGNAQPNYVDFLYLSFVIGTSGQTADVSFAATDTRRIGLIHCVLSYLFNATVLALTINIAASLIS
ncbi:MAG TPA: DUF1345 domain-containing protein [Asticcacaulis sp.]|nr:DUF1345 domain-containing protein [Asticcacaulis sp.]